MANHKSALKRARQNTVRQLRNRQTKTRIKSSMKKVMAAVEEKSAETASSALKAAQSVIAKASKRGVIHKNAAARKISHLTRQVNQINA